MLKNWLLVKRINLSKIQNEQQSTRSLKEAFKSRRRKERKGMLGPLSAKLPIAAIKLTLKVQLHISTEKNRDKRSSCVVTQALKNCQKIKIIKMRTLPIWDGQQFIVLVNRASPKQSMFQEMSSYIRQLIAMRTLHKVWKHVKINLKVKERKNGF